MKTMYLCIHALQVIPASCINRDDTGTPKNCIYGGTSRMRVSSQCWKRAIRMYMKEKFKDSGVRTKLIADELANRLTEETGCSQEETLNFVKNQLDSAGIIAKDKKATAAFFSDQQIALPKMLCNETSAVINLKQIYGYYLNRASKEFERISKITTFGHRQNVTDGAKKQITIISELFRNISEVVAGSDKYDIKNIEKTISNDYNKKDQGNNNNKV